MQLRAAALLLALRAAAAAELRGGDRRDLSGYSALDAGFSAVNILDAYCSSEFTHNYYGEELVGMDETITKDGATGIQLDLRSTMLADGHKLVLTGADGPVELTAKQLELLNGWSPVLSGSRVTVNLMRDAKAEQKDTRSAVKISGYKAEGVCDPQAASICGDTDDRTLSNDQRQGRIGGCTGWLISEDVFIQAGHCGTPGTSARLHLGVQDGNNAPTSMQFAVEQGTYEGVNGGVGNDWGVGRLLPNSQTGLKAGESNNGAGWYALGAVPGSAAGNVIRITGYGTAATQSRWQKTHTGNLVSIGSTSLRYVPDTTGGNSGSPVVLNDGDAIGVHTHGGCSATGGSNAGTRIDKPEFAAKISAMLNPGPPTPPPVPAPCTLGARVEVKVQTDSYGSETSWELKDTCTNSVVGSADQGSLSSATLHEDEFCVAPAEFSFTISDSFGDGICCNYGEGSYELYLNGVLAHEGGEFAASETKLFGSCDATPPTPPPTSPTPPPTTSPTPPPTTSPTPPPTPPPTTSPTLPPTNVDPPTPPADGVITVDLFQMQFTFTPAGACIETPVGGPAGGSPHQCAQACAVLENCAGFGELGDQCFLVDSAPDDCGSDAPNGVFYERGATMYFDN